MGLNPLWQEDVFLTVQDFCYSVQLLEANPYDIIDTQKDFLIHLVPINNNFRAEDLISLQTHFQVKNKQLVHLWEDVWLTKREQTISRFKSFLALNKGIHGRKAKIVDLDSKQASQFLNTYHLQGFVKAKYNYGLTFNNDIVAAASFSDKRPMPQKGENYTSAELVRFASRTGFTVIGGLSKLIKHYLKLQKTNDLMTYADRDWSLGKGYEKLDFQLSEETKPLILFLNKENLLRFVPHRLPKNLLLAYKNQNVLNLDEFLSENEYVKVFNTGNLKYHLYL